jgi:hypothetical protein
MFQKLTSALAGRTTAFSAAFFLTGNVMHVLHRLDTSYIAFMVALMGIVLGHSVKEDYFSPGKTTPSP